MGGETCAAHTDNTAVLDPFDDLLFGKRIQRVHFLHFNALVFPIILHGNGIHHITHVIPNLAYRGYGTGNGCVNG